MELQVIQHKIYEVRGLKIMLDFDLAELYDVETRILNQAVKRNIDIFPDDFMFQLSPKEWKVMSSQIVMTSPNKRPKTALPLAFTEHGVTMLANILKSKKARIIKPVVPCFVNTAATYIQSVIKKQHITIQRTKRRVDSNIGCCVSAKASQSFFKICNKIIVTTFNSLVWIS